MATSPTLLQSSAIAGCTKVIVYPLWKTLTFFGALTSVWIFATTAFAISGNGGLSRPQEESVPGVNYSASIRPILATNCFPCHGPDSENRAADLRLDTREGALADLGGYRAITPGDLDNSELIQRIEESDPDLQMPPADSHKKLSVAQIKLLKDWIAAGANYQEHWAFTPPKKTDLPQTSNPLYQHWNQHPVDAFVLKKLEAEGLTPSPPAPAGVLIRRLFLDLIGLPPTIEQIQRWSERLTASPDPQTGVNEAAYAALVDELLASPHFGERWARRWLDLARYADTNGYEKDRPRSIWPYRDWVIRAFNQDLPFDQFTIHQLAGDLLPDPSQDQLIATGFHRNSMLNEEGGVDPLEFRYYAMTDRVATTGTTWLGLTLGCAQCHTHKYDPLTHTEYFQFMALLNNADEPELALPTTEQLSQQQSRDEQARQLIAELPNQWPVPENAPDTPPTETEDQRQSRLQTAFESWLTDARQNSVEWKRLTPAAATSQTLKLSLESESSIFVTGDITKDDTYELQFEQVPAGTSAIRLEALPDERLPGRGPGMTYFEGPLGDFFLGEFQIYQKTDQESLPMKIRSASESYAHNHFGNAAVSAQLALDGNPETGWSCAGRFGERHVAVFHLAEPLPEATDLVITMRFGRHYPCSLGKFRISITNSNTSPQALAYSPAVENLLARPADQTTLEEREVLLQTFLMQATELQEPVAKIRDLQRPLPTPRTLIFRERPAHHPRPTFRHHRGEFLQPREEVTADVPSFLPPLSDTDAPANRLALARWLVDPQHPMTARVQVNRIWGTLFGQGLVRTVSDFGIQGASPSHPELLDWLAVDFHEQGLSFKRLIRQLVTSATYRQSSASTSEQRQTDPSNRWLGRASRLRLDAEQIRDALLTASGLLEPRLYGPPVFPPQPEGATETAYGGSHWNTSTGGDRFRRGIYTFRKRTAPYAMFSTFDAPSGEFCLGQREMSNTPLQSLTLLNDRVVMEAAIHLGTQIQTLEASDEQRVQNLFQRILSREGRPEEIQLVLQFRTVQQERLASGEISAEQLLGDAAPANAKTTPADSESASNQPDANIIDPIVLAKQLDLAAWTLTTRALLNLDEAITRN